MGRKKKEPDDDGKSYMIYTCPYLNLVYAIFDRQIEDLTLEVINDIFPWKKTKNDIYLKYSRRLAFQFFFEEKSRSYKDFMSWCDLTGFDYRYWQRRALIALALKCLQSPRFYSLVLERNLKPHTLLRVDAMIARLSRLKTFSLQ